MKLYIYEHCPFCLKTQLMAGLTELPITFVTQDNDDEETPMGMIGKKMLPILEKEDGTFLPESMDIVHYLNEKKQILLGPTRPEVSDILEKAKTSISGLQIPRSVRYPFAEFKTESARNYYIQKKSAYYGDFDALLAKTDAYLAELAPLLNELSALITSDTAINGLLSDDDIHVFGHLHHLSFVKGMVFPERLNKYINTLSLRANLPLLWDHAI